MSISLISLGKRAGCWFFCPKRAFANFFLLYIYIGLNLVAHLSMHTIYIKHDFKGVCNDKCIIIIYTIACLIPPILPAASKPKVRWKPPDANLVKINFDGAIFKDENSSGIGVVVRDHTSAILVSLSQSLSAALQPAKIEAIAIAQALEFG